MTERSRKPGFAASPGDPNSWVRAPGPLTNRTPSAEFTARLMIDVAPALRGWITIAAFERGVTVADMLRALLDRKFPADGGAAS
jgi:hypothetical protein